MERSVYLKAGNEGIDITFSDVKNTPLVEVPDANVKISAEIRFKVFLFNPILFPFNHSGAV